jgi:hypothetical protein
VTKPGRVVETFTGGVNVETDAEFARRILGIIRYKQGAGNAPQLRAWARRASSSVEDVFTYPCAFHAGSVLFAPTQKRGTTEGPLARIPNVATLAAVVAAMTPPGSVLVPVPPWTLVTAPVAQPADVRVFASFPRAKSSGWRDASPWPNPAFGGAAEITAVASQTSFTVTTTGPAPDAARPAIMVFNALKTRWEKLAVSTVADLGGGAYQGNLSGAASFTVAIGDWVSPDMDRRLTLAKAIEAYLDSLGPGEVVNLATDTRAHRAMRFPLPADESPSSAGPAISLYLQEALAGALSGAAYEFDNEVPAVPSDPAVGPSLVVARRFGVYPTPTT